MRPSMMLVLECDDTGRRPGLSERLGPDNEEQWTGNLEDRACPTPSMVHHGLLSASDTNMA